MTDAYSLVYTVVMHGQKFGYQTDAEWVNAADVPSEAAEQLKKFEPVSPDIGYLTDFIRKTAVVVRNPIGLEWLEIDVEGILAGPHFPHAVFNVVSANFAQLASFQNLEVAARFQRKGAVQNRQYCSSVSFFSRHGVTKAHVSYYGGGSGDEVSPVGWEIARQVAAAGFPWSVENGQVRHLNEGKVGISHWNMFCEIEGITSERVSQMSELVNVLCSHLYEYSWSVGTVDKEIATPRGFEIIETVRAVGLTADEYKINARYCFTSKQGWDVIRDCCGEGERFHHLIGDFFVDKRKVLLCVATTATGHRLCFFSRKATSEDQLKHIESILGVGFQHEPFTWPGKQEKE